ncbi:SET [Caligus rogercresseyi]|uniref:SET n=1 Tax=Caligus rogercresseyi TaxID=217165 RepID=A0A7T8GQ91_CALRO|nr:SET [Caligus rogercresseyi]
MITFEQRYNGLRKPYFEKRSEVIRRIPKFWLTAFINHPKISAVIEEDEEDCLRHLSKVEVEEFEDIKSGYRIKFTFNPENPYFSNEFLTKEFHLGSTEILPLTAKAAQRVASNKSSGARKRALLPLTDPSMDDIAEVIKDEMWPILCKEEEDDLEEEEVDESVVVLEEEKKKTLRMRRSMNPKEVEGEQGPLPRSNSVVSYHFLTPFSFSSFYDANDD